ncbi:BQ2448_3026 [Microbotryum intermedium]|uniref:BQ2448_3026 protein n=1 Tax=Microbotryum intermedium TaxID=269621 RepID=A0A238FJU1_9BASI|nr:BQ2448_3026 [Microbotryum intermedium]
MSSSVPKRKSSMDSDGPGDHGHGSDGADSSVPTQREPATGPIKAKPGRSRAACSACRANKQKCDAAIRHPCRRCELYNLECDAPLTAANSSNGTPNHKAAASITMPSLSPYAGRPEAQLLDLPPISAASGSLNVANGTDSSALASTLREIQDRLRQIENGLEADRRVRNAAPSTSPNAPGSAQRATSTVPSSNSRLLDVDPPPESMPLHILLQTVDKIEALSNAEASVNEWVTSEEKMIQDTPNTSKPDAIARGLISVEDADAAFAFFHDRIAPWIPIFGDAADQSALGVQSRSPFFFHVVLCVTNYYNQATSERAREVYRGLTELVNLILAHQILAADPNLIGPDFIRGLLLIIYYKPATYAARGITDVGRATHSSKVNHWSSIMIHGIIHRTAEAIGLPRAPHAFLAALDASRLPGAPPIDNEVLCRLRTHYALCIADVHGSLQSGRVAATDPTAALETTRAFASLLSSPMDARMAAQLELYAIVRTPRGQHPFKLRLAQLGRINDELDSWESYWRPILTPLQNSGDLLAYTLFQGAANFVTFIANSATFTRWSIERQRSLDSGGNGRPVLTTSDWAHLQRATDSAMKTIFALSVESRAGGDPLRTCRWADSVNGVRKPLTLDLVTVDDYRTALDTSTCIVSSYEILFVLCSFVYSLILLVRMASAGLISSNLVCRRSDYEAGADLDTPKPLTSGDKLPILLELGANFLRAISPSPQHPARKHAILLHMILKTGLGEHSLAGTATKSPASTTSPNSTASVNLPTTASRSAAPARDVPPVAAAIKTNTGSLLPTTLPNVQDNTPSLDSCLFDLSAPNLPVSGGALLIPTAPGDATQEPGEALRSILTEVNPSFFGMGANYSDELDQFASMDWGSL